VGSNLTQGEFDHETEKQRPGPKGAVEPVKKKLMNLIFIDSFMKIDQIFSTGSCCFLLGPQGARQLI
jgi:hypothetical protein